MRAARIQSYGDRVEIDDVGVPQPGRGQVLVANHGSSLNPVDLAIRAGWMSDYLPAQPPFTLGIDLAGVVTAVGADVAAFAPGDRVFGVGGLLQGGTGALAEYVVAEAERLAPAPRSIDLYTAGTLPLAGISALQAVEENLDVAPGDTVFIHGGSGGVGRWAIAIAKNRGARVIATARGNGVDAAKSVGADEIIDTDTTDFTKEVSGLDSAVILVGGEDGDRSLGLVNRGGRVVSLVGPLDEAAASERGLEVALQGTTVTTQRLVRLAALVDAGLVPQISSTYPLDDAEAAFAALEAGGLHGKLAVTIR